MSMGYISPEYQSNAYFDNFKENMIGLAPMLSSDTILLDRQFLYKFINAKEQAKLALQESYAFNGGETFAIGGDQKDWESLVCVGKDTGFDFENEGVTRENAIEVGYNEMNFAPQLVYFEGVSLTSKIANYVLPIKQ